jgi:endonuclease/exonuclease/phosphatase family metal-dependent hydrolase
VPLPLPLNQNPDRPSAIVSDGLNRFSQFPFGGVTRQRWAGCDDSAADCLSLKGFSVARTELAPGVCVDVYNLHGEAGNTDHDLELKDENMRDLIDFMLAYSDGRAVIVGGDFNMRIRREQDAANLDKLESETGLQDACIAQGIVDIEEIDKFFFRSNDRVTFEPVSCRLEIEKFVAPDGGPLSDHDPLAVRFEWVARPDPAFDCL